MDTKKNIEGGVRKAKDAYELYRRLQPDGVIAADDNAQSMFVVPYLKDRYDVPVIFCGVNALPDLKNKKMAGVRKGSGMDVLLRGYVLGEAAKLKPDQDLEIISMPTGNMDSAVDQKVVNAAFIWEPFTSQSLSRGNTAGDGGPKRAESGL